MYSIIKGERHLMQTMLLWKMCVYTCECGGVCVVCICACECGSVVRELVSVGSGDCTMCVGFGVHVHV